MIVKCLTKNCENNNKEIDVPETTFVICGPCGSLIREPSEAEIAAEQATQREREAARQALLDKLGITADEAKLLLS